MHQENEKSPHVLTSLTLGVLYNIYSYGCYGCYILCIVLLWMLFTPFGKMMKLAYHEAKVTVEYNN